MFYPILEGIIHMTYTVYTVIGPPGHFDIP